MSIEKEFLAEESGLDYDSYMSDNHLNIKRDPMIQGDLFKDRFVVQVDLFSGEELAYQMQKKRTSFVGFFLTENERNQLYADAKIEGVSVSEFIRVQLGFEK